MPDLIDLRSDTVTKPSPEMRRAMAEAEVGDDVFGDDPTVIALEQRAAELTGKEAALFVASGTMGNLVSHMAWVPRGGEIIAESGSHLSWDEGAGHAVISGASLRPVKARRDGTLDEQEVEDLIFDDSDPHLAPTSLLVLENTHAVSGAQPLPADYMDRMSVLGHKHGLKVHVDGARLFNAVVATQTPASRLLQGVDSATFCLSKGLACPIGSVVVGPKDFIWRARRARKMVGGGMRQVGILAAAGLIALRDGPTGMIDRLADDHANARRLAEALAAMPGIGHLDPAWVKTNFVLFSVMHPGQGRDDRADPALRAAFVERCKQDGLLLVNYPNGEIRACTHYGIEAAHIDRTIEIMRAALTAVGAAPVTSVAGAGR
ncbi:MAG: GntG family PLP-dependent aldolase [Chloroflexota bacterium]